MKRLIGFVFLGIGGLLLVRDLLLSRYGLSLPGVLLALSLVFVGLILAGVVKLYPSGSKDTSRAGSKPQLPTDFDADYWHRNIALDSKAGRLWLREGTGKTGVFHRSELVGWEMQNSNFASRAVVGPRVTPMDNRLIVKTRSLEKPVWTVPFDAHGSLTGRANHLNHEEMKAWYERLNVFINHSA